MAYGIRYWAAACAVLITIVIVLASCAGRKGTMRLYDSERVGQLPAERVARIAINDMKGFGYRLMMRFDTRDSLIPRDTIEVLPGEHGLQLRFLTADPTMPIERYEQRVARSRSCFYFEFVAQAGHLYEFRIVDLKFSSGWKVDLVDLTDTTRVIHESGCRRDKWWQNIHEQES